MVGHDSRGIGAETLGSLAAPSVCGAAQLRRTTERAGRDGQRLGRAHDRCVKRCQTVTETVYAEAAYAAAAPTSNRPTMRIERWRARSDRNLTVCELTSASSTLRLLAVRVSCQIRLGYAAVGLSYAATNPVTSSKCGEFAGLSRFGKIRGVGAGSTPRQPPL